MEINLATYDKQNEILNSLDSGGVSLMYLLAKTDSKASQSDIEALKEIPHIKNIVNSEAAMRAVVGSSLCMEQIAMSEHTLSRIFNSNTALNIVFNSDTALKTLTNSALAMTNIVKIGKLLNIINSNKAREHLKQSINYLQATVPAKATIEGKFLPIYANYSFYFKVYNGTWSEIAEIEYKWLKDNINNPIATKIQNTQATSQSIVYYDLNGK